MPVAMMGGFVTEPRAHHDRQRDTSERHTADVRNLFNRLLGCLYHRLRQRTLYDPRRAFVSLPPTA